MSLIYMQSAVILFAALNFGVWQHSFNAGVFVLCSLVALCWNDK